MQGVGVERAQHRVDAGAHEELGVEVLDVAHRQLLVEASKDGEVLPDGEEVDVGREEPRAGDE